MSTQYKDRSEVPTAALIARLKEIAHAVTQGRDAIARECSMRVPAELDRDMDLVCAEAARRLELAYEPKLTTSPITSEQAERAAVVTDAMVTAIRNAVLSCGHNIIHEQIVLWQDGSKTGNALAQLHERLRLALTAALSGGGDGWVKCSERLPEKWADVVVHNPSTGWRQVVHMNHSQSAWILGDNGDFMRVDKDNHLWFPVPKPAPPPTTAPQDMERNQGESK